MHILDTDHKILCVDDDESQIEIYKTIFDKLQSKVDFFVSSEEAIKAANIFSYHLVITDLNMPKYNGIDVYHEINKICISKNVKSPKFMLVTGAEEVIKSQFPSSNFNLAFIYKNIGFSSYFSKPFNYEVFFEECLYLLTTDI